MIQRRQWWIKRSSLVVGYKNVQACYSVRRRLKTRAILEHLNHLNHYHEHTLKNQQTAKQCLLYLQGIRLLKQSYGHTVCHCLMVMLCAPSINIVIFIFWSFLLNCCVEVYFRMKNFNVSEIIWHRVFHHGDRLKYHQWHDEERIDSIDTLNKAL